MSKEDFCYKILMEGYKPVEIYQRENLVCSNGSFALPEIIAECKSPVEALAYMKGIRWAVQNFGGKFLCCKKTKIKK